MESFFVVFGIKTLQKVLLQAHAKEIFTLSER